MVKLYASGISLEMDGQLLVLFFIPFFLPLFGGGREVEAGG